MFATPSYNQDLLDAPRWHVELPGRRICVAENAEGVFLVLFTSPARAHDFVSHKALGTGGPASPALYSITRAEFMSRAETSAAGGALGVVVDPQADGEVGVVIEFETEPGLAPGDRRLA
jgi:hypothetical protein